MFAEAPQMIWRDHGDSTMLLPTLRIANVLDHHLKLNYINIPLWTCIRISSDVCQNADSQTPSHTYYIGISRGAHTI